MQYHYKPSQFDLEGGTTACSCISLVAVFYVATHRDIPLEDIDWTYIVEMGTTMWKMWNKKGGEGMPDLITLLKMQDFTEFYDVLRVEFEVAGNLFQLEDRPIASYSLEGAFEMIERKRWPFISLTENYSTVTIFYDNALWWLFDSHGIYRSHHSTLIKFQSYHDLIDFIRQRRRRQREHASIYSMYIFTIINTGN